MGTMTDPRLALMEGSIRLSHREMEVLSLIGRGFCSREVADILFISKRTVDFHLASVYDKLKVNNRIQACRAAERLGLLPMGRPHYLG